MVIYEVNLSVDRDIAPDYAAWLPMHIAEVIALPGFIGATWFERDGAFEGAAENQVHWSIHYALHNRADLDAYLRFHAPRLREEGIKRFGNKFQASRRVLIPQAADSSTSER